MDREGKMPINEKMPLNAGREVTCSNARWACAAVRREPVRI